MRGYTFAGIVLVTAFQTLLTEAQTPPRFNIPGAVLVQGGRPAPAHRHKLNRPPPDAAPAPIRIRKPIPNALPISIPIREEAEDIEDNRPSILDDEVARLSISSLQASRALDNEPEPPRPLPFRPERPIPVPSPSPRPFIRQDFDEEEPLPIVRQPPPQPQRQAPPPVRQHSPPPQPARQKAPRVAANPRPPPPQYLDEEGGRRNGRRKPEVQIIRKYRTDNDDGSITWGFENEDGTFKEENIGADCIIRGKYGYVDPEGTRREYNYEAGNKCDQPEEELQPEELPPQQIIPNRPHKG